MTPAALQTAIGQAAKVRNDAIAFASQAAPTYEALDAAASAANHAYQRTVRRAYARLAFA